VTLTLPLDFARGGEVEQPVVGAQAGGPKPSGLFSPQRSRQVDAQVTVEVNGFSDFQPIQFHWTNSCRMRSSPRIAAYSVSWRCAGWEPHVYYVQGRRRTRRPSYRASAASRSFRLYHQQIGTFFYGGLGFYTDVGSVGASGYAGVALEVNRARLTPRYRPARTCTRPGAAISFPLRRCEHREGPHWRAWPGGGSNRVQPPARTSRCPGPDLRPDRMARDRRGVRCLRYFAGSIGLPERPWEPSTGATAWGTGMVP